jgi:hypothetical protein
MLAVAAAAVALNSASAAEYPSRPIRIVVPFSAGDRPHRHAGKPGTHHPRRVDSARARDTRSARHERIEAEVQ